MCYDGLKNEDFILHCTVVLWSGDTPALAKLMCTCGHNAYQGCRYCNLCGIYQGHVYFPTQPPKKVKGTKYDPKNLPLRTHSEYLQSATKWTNTKNNREKKQLELQSGKFNLLSKLELFIYFD